jgi:hypothetical protein
MLPVRQELECEPSRILERVRFAASSYVTMELSLLSHGKSVVVCARHPAA